MSISILFYIAIIIDLIIYFRAKPKRIGVDNGPEFLATALVDCCEQNKIELKYIRPGKPSENGFVKRFNKSFRQDILDAYWFNNLRQVRQLAEEWKLDYYHHLPH